MRRTVATKVSTKLKKEVSPLPMNQLAIEEPLEIRLEYWANGEFLQKSISITMRSPGHDFELATGFLFTEGIIQRFDEIKQIRHCGPAVEGQDYQNIVRVELQPHVVLNTTTMERNFYTTSSCGVCGKTSIEALRVNNPFGLEIRNHLEPGLRREVLLVLPDRMQSAQRVFQLTGGCHASGLFDIDGNLLCLREDVGRHNALDKVVGWALRNRYIPLYDHVVLVSGRASFELMQKASIGGIPLLAAVGAPSSLAVQFAQEFDMTLIGFLNSHGFTIYHDPGRIQV
jgi:FdhD protein